MHTNLFLAIEDGSNVDYSLRRVSLESDFLQNATKLLKSVLPDFISKLISNKENFVQVNNYKTNVLKIHHLDEKNIDLLMKTAGVGFINYSDRRISVPEDFNGNLLNYLELVRKEIAINFSILDEIISEFVTVISSFITNDFSKTSLKDFNELNNSLKNYLEHYKKGRKEFFADKANGISILPLGKVVNNTHELESIFIIHKSLTESINKISIKELDSKVDTLIDLLGLCLESLNKEGVIVSSNMAKTISEGSYKVAKAVESYIALYFDAMLASHVVYFLVEKLEK